MVEVTVDDAVVIFANAKPSMDSTPDTVEVSLLLPRVRNDLVISSCSLSKPLWSVSVDLVAGFSFKLDNAIEEEFFMMQPTF